MYSKNELRKIAKSTRDSLDNHSISARIIDNILSWDIFKQAKNIMMFYPIKSEINLLPLLNTENKNFYFPKIINDDIQPVFGDINSRFIEGKFGTQEPEGCFLEDYSVLNLIFLPALAVNSQGYRLGYGKGFYDRFIKLLDKHGVTLCVPIAKSLIFEDFTVEQHDERFNFIITEEAIISSNLDDPNPLHHKLNI